MCTQQTAKIREQTVAAESTQRSILWSHITSTALTRSSLGPAGRRDPGSTATPNEAATRDLASHLDRKERMKQISRAKKTHRPRQRKSVLNIHWHLNTHTHTPIRRQGSDLGCREIDACLLGLPAFLVVVCPDETEGHQARVADQRTRLRRARKMP